MIADESLNKKLVDALREAGYSITYIAEKSPGISDEEIVLNSLNPPEIILSEDKDFGELIYHRNVSAIGVILLRYSPIELYGIQKQLLGFLNEYKTKLQGKFVVISLNKIRIRTL